MSMGAGGRRVLMLAALAALAILTDSAEDEGRLQLPAGVQIADGLKISKAEAQEWVPSVGGQILVSDEVIDQTDEKAWAHEMRTRDSQPQRRRRPGRRRKLRQRTTSPASLDIPFITAGPLEGGFVVDAVMGPATPPEHIPHPAEQENSEQSGPLMRKRVKYRRRGGKRRHRINSENGEEDISIRKEINDGDTDPAQEHEDRLTNNVRLGYLARGLVHALSTSAPEYERPWRRRKDWNNKSVTWRPAEENTADVSTQVLEKYNSAEEANADTLRPRNPNDGQHRVKFTTETGIINDKSYRRPFSSAKSKHNDAEKSGHGVSLKEILKKSGSQSLSEVLQNNNLSLSDLLSGKKYAISALRITTLRPEETTTLSDYESTPTDKSFEDEPIKFKTRPSQPDREMSPLQPIINKYQWKLEHMLEQQERILSEQRKDKSEKGVTVETTLSQENQDYIKGLETTKELIAQTEERQSRLTEMPAVKVSPSEDEPLLRSSLGKHSTFQNFFRSEQVSDQNSYKSEEPSNLDSPQEWINFVDEIKQETGIATTVKYSQSLNTIVNTANTSKTNATNNELNINFNVSQSKSAAKLDTSNRLMMKPRLRLPPIKNPPRRILNPDQKKESHQMNTPMTISNQESDYQTTLTSDILQELHSKDDNGAMKVNMSQKNQEKYDISPSKKQNISFDDNKIVNQIDEDFAFDVSIAKSKSVSVKDMLEKTNYITTQYKTRPNEKLDDVRIVTAPNLVNPDDIESNQANIETSGKEELLEILKDSRGGEKLARVLAERNMTLKELLDHRERGSSQVHLADIFHNASKEPNPDEPFLSKSSIEPMSKQTYPLRALIDANRHDNIQRLSIDPAPFIEFVKQADNNEEHLGIVTLFDKFNSKHIDPKDIKRDSDGSSYFTSVFNMKPTEEEIKELNSKATVEMIPRSNIHFNNNMHAWNSDGPSVSEQFAQRITAGPPSPDYPSIHIADADGDGLIVLDDIQRMQQAESTILHASNQRFNENYDDIEPSVFRKLPVSVRSAIIASTSIVGVSVVLFLAAFMMCRWRQKRKNILRYNCSFNGKQLRSSTLPSRRNMNHNKSSRSISPILDNSFFRSQKVNTLDSQGKRDAQDYLWETIRRPFQ